MSKIRLLIVVLIASLLAFPLPLLAQSEISVTTLYSVQLRAGPAATFRSLGVIPVQTNLPALARNAESTWVNVQHGQSVGWVAVKFVQVNGDLAALPVKDASGQTSGAQPSQPAKPVVLSAATLRQFCTTKAPIADAPAFDGAPGLHPIILLKESGGVHTFNSRAPRAIISNTGPQLAACIGEPTTVTIETCRYSRSGFGGPTYIIYRDVRAVTVVVYAIQTGQVVAQETIRGAPPRECRQTERFSITQSIITLVGAAVNANDVINWVEPIANRR